ncbi:MAG TPA: carbonic anhydrase family protein [Pyrinomonadaceae bacterium]|jgi:carbonic anhydrase|nr:carbonic anhydrase family protein [Pyrinomonadaceae bacterium]
MRKPYYLLRLALLAVLSISVLTPVSRTAAQETSSGVGTQQTPIDIRAADLTFVEHLPSLGFSYGTNVKLEVVNSGSPGEFATVRANLPDGGGQLTVDGVTYKLRQFHWHTPSEHQLDGEEFPMEMHLVHQADDGSFLVVGVWVVRGKQHNELKKLFADLPQDETETRTVGHFNLTKLLPQGLESFRYDGSLTTPPFNEGVKWVVLAQPIEMSPAQIDAFKAIFPDGNSREVQPLNGRTILTDVAVELEED